MLAHGGHGDRKSFPEGAGSWNQRSCREAHFQGNCTESSHQSGAAHSAMKKSYLKFTINFKFTSISNL